MFGYRKMNKIYCIISIVCCCFVGCVSKKTEAPITEYMVNSGHYFPIGDIPEWWFGKHLDAMQEISLYKMRDNKNIEAYRFLYLPTWGNPICVRVVKVENGYYIKSIKLTGMGGYKEGKIGFLKTRRIDDKSLPKHFNTLLDKVVWNDNFKPKRQKGCDGSEWIIEGLKNGKYIVFDIWCADTEQQERGMSDYVALCKLFITMGKFDENVGHYHNRQLMDPLDKKSEPEDGSDG